MQIAREPLPFAHHCRLARFGRQARVLDRHGQVIRDDLDARDVILVEGIEAFEVDAAEHFVAEHDRHRQLGAHVDRHRRRHVARILAHVVDDLRLRRSSRPRQRCPWWSGMRNGCSKMSWYAPACAAEQQIILFAAIEQRDDDVAIAEVIVNRLRGGGDQLFGSRPEVMTRAMLAISIMRSVRRCSRP